MSKMWSHSYTLFQSPSVNIIYIQRLLMSKEDKGCLNYKFMKYKLKINKEMY